MKPHPALKPFRADPDRQKGGDIPALLFKGASVRPAKDEQPVTKEKYRLFLLDLPKRPHVDTPVAYSALNPAARWLPSQ